MTKEAISTEHALKLALEQRITDYLSAGGLFNPELADHVAVRDLLMDCREALAEQPAQQAPIGSVYRYGKDSSGKQWHGIKWTALGLDLPDGTLIYTSPPAQRSPLTVTEVEQILAQHNYEIHGDRARYIVRMTEAAHNIKGNT